MAIELSPAELQIITEHRSKTAAAPASAPAPAPTAGPDFAAVVAELQSLRARLDAAPAPAAPAARPPGPVYVSPGAPMGSPDAGLDSDPTSWTRDQTKAYEADGTLMQRGEAWPASQPGGGRSPFPSRTADIAAP